MTQPTKLNREKFHKFLAQALRDLEWVDQETGKTSIQWRTCDESFKGSLQSDPQVPGCL